MILLEGPDGAGKTRLALRLQDDLGVPIEPKVVESDMSSTIPLLEWVLQQMSGWPEKKIYDRFPLISEYVYGPIYKHKVREGFDNLHQMSGIFEAFYLHNPVVIYCLPSFDEVWDNIHDEITENEAVQGDQIRGVYARYVQEAARSMSLVWDYTRDTDTYGTLLQQIRTLSYRRNHLEY